jgi:hypothetical protein
MQVLYIQVCTRILDRLHLQICGLRVCDAVCMQILYIQVCLCIRHCLCKYAVYVYVMCLYAGLYTEVCIRVLDCIGKYVVYMYVVLCVCTYVYALAVCICNYVVYMYAHMWLY